MRKFYTYMYLRYWGEPYYVGKGCGKRAYTSQGRVVPRPPSRDRILVQEFPDERAALDAEIFLIAYYGRKDLGTGVLRNRTDGGEGVSNLGPTGREKLRQVALGNKRPLGHRHSIISRQRMSVALTGRPFSAAHRQKLSVLAKARRRSPETRAKMSASHQGKTGNIGYRHSVDTRLKMSASQKGKKKPPRTPEHSAKIWATRRAKLCQ